MKSFSIRLGIITVVLAAIVAGATALAKNANWVEKANTTQCSKWLRKNVCTTTCEESVYSIGACRDDTTGSESGITFECCCCTDGAENRSWIGG